MVFKVRTEWGIKIRPIQETATYIKIQNESDTGKLLKEFQDQIFWCLYDLSGKLLVKRKAAIITKYWILGYRSGMNKNIYNRAADMLTANYYPTTTR